jgi:hypothetical protein
MRLITLVIAVAMLGILTASPAAGQDANYSREGPAMRMMRSSFCSRALMPIRPTRTGRSDTASCNANPVMVRQVIMPDACAVARNAPLRVPFTGRYPKRLLYGLPYIGHRLRMAR